MGLREPDEVSTAHLMRSALALRRRYVLALASLAILALVGGLLLRAVIKRHRAISAHIMQVLGQQRTLSQALCKAALALTTADRAPERQSYRGEIATALNGWRGSHQAMLQNELIREAQAQADAPARQHLQTLVPEFEAMASAAERLLTLTQGEPYADLKKLEVEVDTLLVHERPYQAALETLTQDFVRESAARDEAAEDAGLVVTAALLLMLGLESLLIFRPALRQLERSIADLAAAWTEVSRGERERKAILNALPDLLIRYDRRGSYLSAYSTSSEIPGAVQEALRGRSLDSLVPPTQHAALLGSIAQVLSRGGVERLDCMLPSVDGGEGSAEATASQSGVIADIDGQQAELRLVALGAEEVLVLVRDVTTQRHIERSVLEVVETEQQRIGKELHNGVCQSMAGVSLLTRSLVREAERGAPITPAQLDSLARLLEPCVVEARRMARGLVPVELTSHGLAVALQRLGEDVASQHRVPIESHIALSGYVPSPEVGHQLYRIAQEALSHAARHGEPKAITLRVGIEQDGSPIPPAGSAPEAPHAPAPSGASHPPQHAGRTELVLTVQYDGAGTSRESIKPRAGDPRGLALQIISYRARCIGGFLLVDRQPGGVTTIRCRLPLGT